MVKLSVILSILPRGSSSIFAFATNTTLSESLKSRPLTPAGFRFALPPCVPKPVRTYPKQVDQYIMLENTVVGIKWYTTLATKKFYAVPHAFLHALITCLKYVWMH